jgi:hypothetical protein
LNEIQNPKSKIATFIDVDSFTAAAPFLKGKIPLKLADRKSLLKGIMMFKYSPMYWVVEDTMKLLIPSGIPQWMKKFINEVVIKGVSEEQKEPKVFTVEDLEFGFVIWGVACGICLVAFVAEILYFYLIKMFESVFGVFAVVKNLKFVK